jgi:hypothetical protein
MNRVSDDEDNILLFHKPVYYIMAGLYPVSGQNKEPYFGIVRPSAGTKPYITTVPDGGSLLLLCKHHSHFYRLSTDLKTATLEKHSGEAGNVKSPQTVTLTPEQTAEIKGVIDSGKLYCM